jgi:hypothetical protein
MHLSKLISTNINLKYLPEFKEQLLPELVRRVVEGDLAARDELLFQLLSYTKLRLYKIIKKIPSLSQDIDGLVSYLILWLLKLISINEDARISHYVAYALKKKCINYRYKMTAFGPNGKRRGPRATQTSLVEGMLLDTDTQNATSQLDSLEFLESLAQTDREHAYIQAVHLGYKGKELQCQLQISKEAVNWVRRSLIKRGREKAQQMRGNQ